MNNNRYKITEDRIDLTLYECFESGILARYFESDDKLKEWISGQNLNILFKDNKLDRSGIDWFVPNANEKLISEMSVKEIYEYLGKAIIFISERNSL